MAEPLTPIVYVLVIGGIAGYLIGYSIKMVSRGSMTIIAIAFLILYMAYTKAIDLNLDEIVATITKFIDTLGPLGFTALASSAPFVGSFVFGLFLGLRRD